MLINLCNALMTGKRWKTPYVTDGLVAMWDGEWNAGPGAHDANATSIVDLSGNEHALNLSGTFNIGSNYIYVDGASGAYGYINDFRFGSPTTQEMCIEVQSAGAWHRFIGENRGLCCTSDGSIGYLYGFGYDASFTGVTQPGKNVKFTQSLTVANARAIFYCNGVISPYANASNTQYSGTTYVFNNANRNKGITGRLYNLRFYSRALTADEIAANYAIDKARFGLP